MKEITMTPEQMIADKVDVEAGYVNNPDDRGGETNHGITKAVAMENKADLIKYFNWDGTMKGLTTPMAMFIYKNKYWNKLQLDLMYKVSPSCADKMLDIGINSGPGQAGIYFQKFLNALNVKQTLYADLVVDGAPGSKTYGALDKLMAKRGKKEVVQRLAMSLVAYQVVHSIDISNAREANETFTWGWLNRQWRDVVRFIGLVD